VDDDPALRSELLAERGYAHHESGNSEAGRADALAAAEAARSVGDAALLARAGIAYQGWVGQWAQMADPVAIELMREGLAGMRDDDPTRPRATAALAQALLVMPGDEALEV